MSYKKVPIETTRSLDGWSHIIMPCVANDCSGKIEMDVLFCDDQAGAVKQDVVYCPKCGVEIDINPKFRVQ